MAKSVVKQDYSRLLSRFETEGQRQLQKINQKQQAYAEELIKFAVMVQGWRDEAVAIDNGEEGNCYKTVNSWFRQWTAENLGDKYQVYHWNTIARAANVLSSPKVLPHLPNTKMALFHLAKSAKGDRSADLQRFKTWIQEGALSTDLTVSEAKKLTESKGSAKKQSEKKGSAKRSHSRQVLNRLDKQAINIDVSVNSLPLQLSDKPAFHKGYAVALLSTEVDEQSGLEVVKILTVLNDETTLERTLDSLAESVP